MGKSRAEEMSFWTVEEFKQFIDCVMDKRQPYMAFMVLNWTGIRLGELLALTAADVDFEKRTISITTVPLLYHKSVEKQFLLLV